MTSANLLVHSHTISNMLLCAPEVSQDERRLCVLSNSKLQCVCFVSVREKVKFLGKHRTWELFRTLYSIRTVHRALDAFHVFCIWNSFIRGLKHVLFSALSEWVRPHRFTRFLSNFKTTKQKEHVSMGVSEPNKCCASFPFRFKTLNAFEFPTISHSLMQAGGLQTCHVLHFLLSSHL